MSSCSRPNGETLSEVDAEFMASARSDISALVAEVRRLRKLLLRAYDCLPRDTPKELREEVEREF